MTRPLLVGPIGPGMLPDPRPHRPASANVPSSSLVMQDCLTNQDLRGAPQPLGPERSLSIHLSDVTCTGHHGRDRKRMHPLPGEAAGATGRIAGAA